MQCKRLTSGKSCKFGNSTKAVESVLHNDSNNLQLVLANSLAILASRPRPRFSEQLLAEHIPPSCNNQYCQFSPYVSNKWI